MLERDVIVAMMLLLGCGGVGSPQNRSPSEAGCAGCTFSFEPITVIGEGREAGTVSDWPIFESNGAHTALVSDSRDAILLFDSAGDRIRVVGSPGDGPGELRGSDRVSWMSSETFLIHRSDGRLVEFGADGVGRDRIRVDPGCILMTSAVPVACVGQGGPDVHSPRVRLLTIIGSVQAEFVPRPGHVQDGRCVMCRAFVAPGGGDLLWAVSRRFHRVELWSVTGSIVMSVDLSRALERIVADSIADDVAGRLRTIGVVAMPSLGGLVVIDGFIRKEDVPAAPVVFEVNGVRVQSEEVTKLQQIRPVGTILSVVDTLGRLVASQFFRGRTFLPAGGAFIADLRESAEELPVLAVGQIRLQRPDDREALP